MSIDARKALPRPLHEMHAFNEISYDTDGNKIIISYRWKKYDEFLLCCDDMAGAMISHFEGDYQKLGPNSLKR